MSNWIYVIIMSIVFIAHLTRTVINLDGFKWYTITMSVGIGFCWGKLLMLAMGIK